MATAILLPKLGNSVESSIVVRWLKQVGERVAAGEPVCEVETDKSTMEVSSPADGVLLGHFFQAGDDVPVMTAIAAVGEPGEDSGALRPGSATSIPAGASAPAPAARANGAAQPAQAEQAAGRLAISPRARQLAERKGLDLAGVAGSGPEGRVIERDVRAALVAQPRLTPLARSMVAKGGFVAPPAGSGAGGRVTAKDLGMPHPSSPTPGRDDVGAPDPDVERIPLAGVRRIVAERMLASLQTTAQLTLNASADARQLLEYRKRLKASPEEHGLRAVTINDLILFAVSRTLPRHPDLNALFDGATIERHRRVHLGVAVDTPRGLVVPVIRDAGALSLRGISLEAGRLARASQDGRVPPDELTGGTFTVTNLGSLGVESFTPVLNPPQVAILGVGGINLKPVELDGAVAFIPHLALSLTINHQVVDGAPGARFLQALARNIAQIELLLAL